VRFLWNTLINLQADKLRKFRHQLHDYQILRKGGTHRELSDVYQVFFLMHSLSHERGGGGLCISRTKQSNIAHLILMWYVSFFFHIIIHWATLLCRNCIAKILTLEFKKKRDY
jgi:hypothetical protein